MLVSPSDTLLIEGGSDERRRLMDVVIAQQDRQYMEALTRYNKALAQRNTLMKQEEEPDADVMVADFFRKFVAETDMLRRLFKNDFWTLTP